MPTGYTYKILENSNFKFEDFAKSCISAFFYDSDSNDFINNDWEKYITYSDTKYYEDKIISYEKILKELKDNGLIDFVNKQKETFLSEIEYNNKEINKCAENIKRINSFIEKANNLQFTDEEHLKYKSFLIEQLEGTKKFDCDNSFNKDMVNNLQEELKNYESEEYAKNKYNDEIKHIEKEIEKYKNKVNSLKEKEQKNSKFIKEIYNVIENIK